MRFDARIRLVELGIELLEHTVHTSTYLRCVWRTCRRVGRQAFEVAVLDTDQVWLAQCEVEVELHQCVGNGAR